MRLSVHSEVELGAKVAASLRVYIWTGARISSFRLPLKPLLDSLAIFVAILDE
jgi:hypothetical protein